jgi:hypothetical protein
MPISHRSLPSNLPAALADPADRTPLGGDWQWVFDDETSVASPKPHGHT